MEGPRSRSFAIIFGGVMILAALTLIFVAERSLRSREIWSLRAQAEQIGDVWSLQVDPSRSVYLYAISEDVEGSLLLLFPLASDGEILPLPAEPFARQLPAEPGTTLLVLADPRPLWSLEKARFRSGGENGPGPVPLTLDDVLSVRGMGPLPDGLPGARVSQIIAPGAPEPDRTRGLWARRF